MRTFSTWSILCVVVGMLAIGLSWVIESYFEPILLIGAVFLLIGAIFSFIAIFKKEKGSTKFLSLACFLIIQFLVTWYAPVQVIRIITWLKNIA